MEEFYSSHHFDEIDTSTYLFLIDLDNVTEKYLGLNVGVNDATYPNNKITKI